MLASLAKGRVQGFPQIGTFPKWTGWDAIPPNNVVNGVTVPTVILGDPMYPLLPWLMKSTLISEDLTKEGLITPSVYYLWIYNPFR